MDKNLNEKIDKLMSSAQLQKEKNNLDVSLSLLKKILNISPKNKRAFNNIGNILKEQGRYDEAIKSYEKSILIDPYYKIAKTNLAILYHEMGNLNKAEHVYKELINDDKNNLSIYFNLSRINFHFFNEKVINLIKDLLKKNDVNNYNKASGYFILAKNENKKKNFEKEIEYLNKGHQFFCKSVNPKTFDQSLSYWLNIIPKKFGKFKIINSNTDDKNNSLLNPIFIIGMPRSGSTLIEGIISSGKRKIPNGGETAIINWAVLKSVREENPKLLFNQNEIIIDYKKISEDIYKKYENLNLLKKEKNFYFVDKSLENFFYIDLILNLFPNAKFIHCERNYIDSIFAIYQNFFTKMTWTHSLENILNYLDNYLLVMENFKKKFGNKIYSVNLSEFTSNSTEISKKIFDFCNLEWAEKSLEFHKRTDLFSKTASNIQIREKIYRYDKDKYNVYKKFIKGFENKYSWLNKYSL
tara:strand:+ start:330 stop:1733 length:1404 start_codon:yes stop_codon:yes gene_type:complete